jgi:hypothetical protein
VVDIEPALPDLENAICRGFIRHCPVCDGYEVIDQKIALWELPWNRLQKPLACPAKSLKTLGGVLNPVSFSQQFPKSPKNRCHRTWEICL